MVTLFKWLCYNVFNLLKLYSAYYQLKLIIIRVIIQLQILFKYYKLYSEGKYILEILFPRLWGFGVLGFLAKVALFDGF